MKLGKRLLTPLLNESGADRRQVNPSDSGKRLKPFLAYP
jgi:hypothetical protein